MRCPVCSETTNKVIDSRLAEKGAEIRRRRECLECGHRFTTRERLEESSLPRIVKRDLRREPYDRRKLVAGVTTACVKRPVSAKAIEQLADRIERRALESGEQEVLSRELGENVIEELWRLDPMAATRFASVFLNFEDAGDYASFLGARRAEGTSTASGEQASAPPDEGGPAQPSQGAPRSGGAGAA